MPSRGEVWWADLEQVSGHEQGGRRPCLVLSDNVLNRSAAQLVVILPLTSRHRAIPLRIPVTPPEGGVTQISYIMPEMIRSVSTTRLRTPCGTVSPDTLRQAEHNVRVVLGL